MLFRSIPDAGAKLAAYYRKLSRKGGESIPQFLIREDTVYDEMWRSLQRLLREKELDFSKFDTTLEDLRVFCGMDPNRSVFHPDDLEGEDAASVRRPTPPTSAAAEADDDAEVGSSRTATPVGAAPAPSRTRKKPKDLIERLMEKGLIPLAALDIIRGWLVLEMSSSSDMDRALVKASAQNELGYDRIKASLLALHEDRGRLQQPQKGSWKGGRVFLSEEHSEDQSWFGETADGGEETWSGEYPEDYGAWFQDPYHDDDWSWQEWHEDSYWQEQPPPYGHEVNAVAADESPEADPESQKLFLQLQEEERELQAMMAETQRNLEQARQAVAASRKDRGWNHASKGARDTSTVMRSKGFPKGKREMQFAQYAPRALWPQKGFKGKGFGKITGKTGKGFPSSSSNFSRKGSAYYMPSVPEKMYTLAVNDLVSSLAKARSDLKSSSIQQ